MPEGKALILARTGLTTNLLVEALSKHFAELIVVLEAAEPAIEIFRRRKKREGLFSSLGQAIFVLTVPKILRKKGRIGSLLRNAGLSGFQNFMVDETVPNLNGSTVDWMNNKYKADVVFVNGTRILSKKFLSNFSCPIVNIHTGITPAFRGIHGGYWALNSGKPELFGTTLHLVDEGTDTGKIIDQKVLEISDDDNFSTYPILQYLAGIELLETHISEIKSGIISPKPSITTEDKLWFHPTLLQYLSKRISKKIK